MKAIAHFSRLVLGAVLLLACLCCPQYVLAEVGVNLQCIFSGELPSAIQTGGKYIPAQDTFHVLVVFAQFPDDRFDTTNVNWPTYPALGVYPGPAYINTFIDSVVSQNSQNGNMSHYFRDMSRGAFKLTGKAWHVVAPHTRQWYWDNGKGIFDINKEVLLKLDSLISFSPFDKWVRGTNYVHPKGQDGIVDMIFMLYRSVIADDWPDNRTLGFIGGQGDLGRVDSIFVDGGARQIKTGTVQSGTTSVVAQSTDGTTLNLPPYRVQIHELAHFFFPASNNWHNGGGFWAMLNDWAFRHNNMRQSVANSFERECLGWIHPDSIGPAPGAYLNRTLMDYATTGQAMKIKVPGSNPDEYFRLEYHLRISQFDVPEMWDANAKGLYIIHQFGSTSPVDEVRLLPADGRWTWVSDTVAHPSYYPSGLAVYKRSGVDPVDGCDDSRLAPFTWVGPPPAPTLTNPSYIHFIRDRQTNQVIEQPIFRGDGRDGFSLAKNNLFTRWSNPNSQNQAKQKTWVAIEIASENSNTIVFNVYIDSAATVALAPSKPQDVLGTKNAQYAASLGWVANGEPDVTTGGGYNVYRAIYYAGGPNPTYSKINSSLVTPTSYVDNNWTNMSIPPASNVYFRYRITAMDNTIKESVKSDSVELLYTYQEYLLGLAYQQKSASSSSTQGNNQRKTVRDGSSNYHLAFSSGGEIFYRKNNGSWQTPVKISYVDGSNDYPSIERGYSNSVMVVWQRNTSPGNYDIYFSMSTDNGSTWPTNYRYTLQTSVACSVDPAPAITWNQSSYRTAVLYSNSSGIQSKVNMNTYPTQGTWIAYALPSSSTGQLPTIASSGNTAFMFAAYQKASDNQVYFNYLNPNLTWEGTTNLSGIVPGTTAKHVTPSITGISGSGEVHAAWKRDPNNGSPSGYQNRIIHRRKSTADGAWPGDYFQVEYEGSQLPSIGGLATNKVDVLFSRIPYVGNGVYKMRFNGTSWSSPTSVAPGCAYPSVSIASTTAKYVYTSTGSSPYTVTLSSETLSKETGQEGTYTRSIAILDSSGGYIELQVHDMYLGMKDGSKQRIDFLPVTLDTNNIITPSNCWSFLSSTKDNLIPEDAEDFVFDYTINMERADQLFEGNPLKVGMIIELGKTDARILGLKNGPDVDIVSTMVSMKGEHAVSLSDFNFDRNNEEASFKLGLHGYTVKKGTFASLGHLFDFTGATQNKELPKDQRGGISSNLPTQYELQNYPNPFNPTTTIRYALPEAGNVSLVVFDVLGRKISELTRGYREAGYYAVTWNGKDDTETAVGSGVYLARITVTNPSGDMTYTKVNKLMLLK